MAKLQRVLNFILLSLSLFFLWGAYDRMLFSVDLPEDCQCIAHEMKYCFFTECLLALNIILFCPHQKQKKARRCYFLFGDSCVQFVKAQRSTAGKRLDRKRELSGEKVQNATGKKSGDIGYCAHLLCGYAR